MGSGRPGRRATVEGTGALVLDAEAVLRPVKRALRDHPRLVAGGRWLDLPAQRLVWSRAGQPWAEVEATLRIGADWGVVRLRHDFEHLSRPTGPQDYWVVLTTTPCRFSGLRWWWRCPHPPSGPRRMLVQQWPGRHDLCGWGGWSA